MMSSTADRCTVRVDSPHDFSGSLSCGCVACAVQFHGRHPERPRRSTRVAHAGGDELNCHLRVNESPMFGVHVARRARGAQ